MTNTFSVLDLSTDDSTLVLSAQYNFPIDRVFSAWLDPEALMHWIKPNPSCNIEILEFEPRVEGAFRINMIMDEGIFGYSGVMKVIDAPNRIEMTWQWDWSEDEEPYPETYLTVQCDEIDGGTRLTLTHERMRSVESRDSHSEGWTGSLTALSEYLEAA
ncbi:MAG: SRPBCC family protein [Fimbriimonadaceae bacterium]